MPPDVQLGTGVLIPSRIQSSGALVQSRSSFVGIHGTPAQDALQARKPSFYPTCGKAYFISIVFFVYVHNIQSTYALIASGFSTMIFVSAIEKSTSPSSLSAGPRVSTRSLLRAWTRPILWVCILFLSYIYIHADEPEFIHAEDPEVHFLFGAHFYIILNVAGVATARIYLRGLLQSMGFCLQTTAKGISCGKRHVL